MRIVLKNEREEYVLDHIIPPGPAAGSSRSIRDAHTKHIHDSLDIGCIMLSCMETEIKKQLMDLGANSFAMMVLGYITTWNNYLARSF